MFKTEGPQELSRAMTWYKVPAESPRSSFHVFLFLCLFVLLGGFCTLGRLLRAKFYSPTNARPLEL